MQLDLSLVLIQSILVNEFSVFEKDTTNFLLIVTTNVKRHYLEEFCACVDIEAKYYLCEIYNILYLDNQLYHLSIEDYYYQSSNNQLSCCDIDSCYTVALCTVYLGDLNKYRILKFLVVNYLNVTQCNTYPKELKGLTFIKEALIIYSYPISYVIKLSRGIQKATKYNSIYSYFYTFCQDHDQLLHILPLRELALYEIVIVSQEIRQELTLENLVRFYRVRKAKVLTAL